MIALKIQNFSETATFINIDLAGQGFSFDFNLVKSMNLIAFTFKILELLTCILNKEEYEVSQLIADQNQNKNYKKSLFTMLLVDFVPLSGSGINLTRWWYLWADIKTKLQIVYHNQIDILLSSDSHHVT